MEGELHGFIAAPSNQSTGAPWGCGIEIIGTSENLGTGYQNTFLIITANPATGIAARLCYDLVLNGYDDWYLPSYKELYKLYLNRAAIGISSTGSYWTSTLGLFGPYSFSFFSDTYFFGGCDGLKNVRAIRSF
ncbi:MAG: hypothetical protein V1903_05785 [Bacteroidota bacterium]